MDLFELLTQAALLEAELELEQAWQLLSAGLQHWPEEPLLYTRRAELLKNAGAVPDALEDLEAALDLLEGHPDQLGHARAHSRLILLRWSQAADWDEISAELRFFNSVHAPDPPIPVPPLDPDPERRLRIGYLSPDFRICSAGMLLEMLFLHHPRDDFDLYAYSLVEIPKDIGQQQFRRLLPQWRDVSLMETDEICETIRADRIDILVDLAGHTSLGALPVMIAQPAPVQISGLTFNGPLGLPQMPWRLTDEIVTPEPLLGEQPLYCDSWIWWPEPDEMPGRDPDALPARAATFGCAHHPGRLSEQTISLWARLLEALPETRLHLKHRFYASEWCRRHMQQRFAHHGIAPFRLVFHPGSDYMDYLAWYRSIDIALDPFPYHGGLVSCEALWMGVPLVTLTHWMRGGESLLRQLGWQIGVAVSENAYLNQALLLATSPSLRREAALQLRTQLRRSSICRGEVLAVQLTEHYRRLWQRACQKGHGLL